MTLYDALWSLVVTTVVAVMAVRLVLGLAMFTRWRDQAEAMSLVVTLGGAVFILLFGAAAFIAYIMDGDAMNLRFLTALFLTHLGVIVVALLLRS